MREAGVAIGEAAVHVAVRDRVVAHLVDIDVRRAEERIGHLIGRAVDASEIGHGLSLAERRAPAPGAVP